MYGSHDEFTCYGIGKKVPGLLTVTGTGSKLGQSEFVAICYNQSALSAGKLVSDRISRFQLDRLPNDKMKTVGDLRANTKG